jgi:hypothetical protein
MGLSCHHAPRPHRRRGHSCRAQSLPPSEDVTLDDVFMNGAIRESPVRHTLRPELAVTPGPPCSCAATTLRIAQLKESRTAVVQMLAPGASVESGRPPSICGLVSQGRGGNALPRSAASFSPFTSAAAPALSPMFGRAFEEEAGTGISFRCYERDLFRPFGVP